MYVLVKKGTKTPIIAEEKLMTSLYINLIELVEIHKHCDKPISLDDFEILSMPEKEIKNAQR